MKVPTVLALVVLALAYGICTYGTAPNTVPSGPPESGSAVLEGATREKANKRQEGSNSPQPPPTVVEAPEGCAVNQPHARTKAEKADAESLDTLTRRYMCFTIVGIFGGVVGLSQLIYQNVLMRRNVAIAEQSMRSGQRADVLLDSVSIQDLRVDGELGEETSIVLVFRNFGNSRADKLMLNFSLIVGDRKTPMWHLPENLLAARHTQGVTFPNFNETEKHPADVVAKINRGEVRFSFDGRISYVDVFKDLHEVECAGTYDPTSKGFPIDFNRVVL